eukprot:gb/GECH01001281.1/.p1 GENE.gb/GECH01001281.1/~~gb/GECH01001281.1/.p1  ORF type:complete len:231 (+),score=17.92 gb/GECH01001281.1/:1-693(+)
MKDSSWEFSLPILNISPPSSEKNESEINNSSRSFTPRDSAVQHLELWVEEPRTRSSPRRRKKNVGIIPKLSRKSSVRTSKSSPREYRYQTPTPTPQRCPIEHVSGTSPRPKLVQLDIPEIDHQNSYSNFNSQVDSSLRCRRPVPGTDSSHNGEPFKTKKMSSAFSMGSISTETTPREYHFAESQQQTQSKHYKTPSSTFQQPARIWQRRQPAPRSRSESPQRKINVIRLA